MEELKQKLRESSEKQQRRQYSSILLSCQGQYPISEEQATKLFIFNNTVKV